MCLRLGGMVGLGCFVGRYVLGFTAFNFLRGGEIQRRLQ